MSGIIDTKKTDELLQSLLGKKKFSETIPYRGPKDKESNMDAITRETTPNAISACLQSLLNKPT